MCSTGIGDHVCRGCKRYSHEIIHWNSYSNEQKKAIHERLDSLLRRVIESKVMIHNLDLLRSQVESKQIRVDIHSDPYTWVFALLKEGATQIKDLDEFGCAVFPDYADSSMVELREIIDKDFYTLSSVHFERYFHQR